MQFFDRSLSRFSLQRWVAVITGTGTLIVGAVNLFGHVLLYNLSLLDALLNLLVLPVFALSILFYLSGVVDSRYLRAFQVAVFAIAGLYLAVVASGEYMSSAVFIIFSIVLYYEFRIENASSLWFLIVGGAYTTAIVFSIMRSAEAAAADMAVSASIVGLAFTNIAVFTSSVVFLFALVLYRQHLIRKRYSDELERRVDERTAELREAVSQRDTMLQEIHHRVGNSLQLLSSFVSLQQQDVAETQRQILKETELRVHAIADVHATLYSQHRLSHLPLCDYATDLVNDMEIAYRSDADINAQITTTKEAHIDFAISFGIILNELITNAAKHGAKPGEKSRIDVSLSDGSSQVLLMVKDYGEGFPRDFEPGTGTEVVDQLVAQNKGTLSRASEHGASVFVAFPYSSVLRDQPVKPAQQRSA